MKTLGRLERHMPAWLWNNLVTISVLGMLLILSVFGFLIVDLVGENSQRIRDIQASRVESCERTYEGVRQVFQVFLPKPGEGTEQQRRDVKKFNNRIDVLKQGCHVQANAKEAK